MNRTYVKRQEEGDHKIVYYFVLYGERVGYMRIRSEAADDYYQRYLHEQNDSFECNFRKMYCRGADKKKLLIHLFGTLRGEVRGFNHTLVDFMKDKERIPSRKEWDKIKLQDALKK